MSLFLRIEKFESNLMNHNFLVSFKQFFIGQSLF